MLRETFGRPAAQRFYGGLRAGEYLKTGPGRGLRMADLAFSPAGDECVLELRIKKKKNRQFGLPLSVLLPATGTSACPVRALRLYCDLRDGQVGSRGSFPDRRQDASVEEAAVAGVLRRLRRGLPDTLAPHRTGN